MQVSRLEGIKTYLVSAFEASPWVPMVNTGTRKRNHTDGLGVKTKMRNRQQVFCFPVYSIVQMNEELVDCVFRMYGYQKDEKKLITTATLPQLSDRSTDFRH